MTSKEGGKSVSHSVCWSFELHVLTESTSHVIREELRNLVAAKPIVAVHNDNRSLRQLSIHVDAILPNPAKPEAKKDIRVTKSHNRTVNKYCQLLNISCRINY